MATKSAIAVCALAVLLTAIAQGAPFDERIQSLRAGTTADLRNELRRHFDTFQRKMEEGEVEGRIAFIRDEAAYTRWVNLEYRLILAMDEKLPLAELADFGLIAHPDGQYSVEPEQYPQWEPLDQRMYSLANADVLESYIPALEAWGFRDTDIEVLRTYVATHNPEQDFFAEAKELVETFARRLQKRKAAGLSLDLDEVKAYRYQAFRLRRAAERQWALGLLDSLDKQRQRILVSFLYEGYDSKIVFGAPGEPFEEALERQVHPLISGEYVQQLAESERLLRHQRETRMEKLMGRKQK
jgi:hypothetical protein